MGRARNKVRKVCGKCYGCGSATMGILPLLVFMSSSIAPDSASEQNGGRMSKLGNSGVHVGANVMRGHNGG